MPEYGQWELRELVDRWNRVLYHLPGDRETEPEAALVRVEPQERIPCPSESTSYGFPDDNIVSGARVRLAELFARGEIP